MTEQKMHWLSRARLELLMLSHDERFTSFVEVADDLRDAAEGISELPKDPVSGATKIVTAGARIVSSLVGDATDDEQILVELVRRKLGYQKGYDPFLTDPVRIFLDRGSKWVTEKVLPQSKIALDVGRYSAWKISKSLLFGGVRVTHDKTGAKGLENAVMFSDPAASRQQITEEIEQLVVKDVFGNAKLASAPVISLYRDAKDGSLTAEEVNWNTEHVREAAVEAVASEICISRRMGLPSTYCYHGPPGTGKTSSALSLGHLIGRRTVIIDRLMVQQGDARMMLINIAPQTIIIDEVDKDSSGNSSTHTAQGIYTTILLLRKALPNTLFIMTANDLKALGAAFLRPERAGLLVYFGPPTRAQARDILLRTGVTQRCADVMVHALPSDMTHDWVDKLGHRLRVRAEAERTTQEAICEKVTREWANNYQIAIKGRAPSMPEGLPSDEPIESGNPLSAMAKALQAGQMTD